MHDVLIDSARRPFLDNAFEIQGSILYLDQGAAELASTTLGLPFISGLGAKNICSLEAASYEDAHRSFMLSTNEGLSSAHTISLTICITKLITESHPDILKAVNVHGQAVTKLVIFSSFSELAHACQASCSLGVEAFSEYSTLLRDAIKSIPSHNSLQINIRHLPMHICTMDASTLVLPSASAAATHARGSQGCVAGLTPPDETSGSSKYEGEGEGGDSGLTLLAHSLCGIIAQLGAKMETSPFYLGPCAKVLATELANLPLPEPVTSAGGGVGGECSAPTLSIIIVDRAMDLVSPCSHGEHPFELAVAAAPRASFKSRAKSSTPNFTEEATHTAQWRSLAMRAHVPAAAAPCSMPLEEASAANGRYSSGTQCTALPAEQLLLGGLDVWDPSDKTCMERMEQLLSRKPKDVLPLLRKWLKEALRHENRNPSVRSKAGSVPLSELSVLITDLASIHSDTTPTVDSRDGDQRGRSTALRHKGLLALTVSVLQAAEGPLAVRWEASAALEKQLLLMMVQAGDMSGVQKTLLDALTNAKANKGPLCVSDVLQLLPLVYSLWPDAAPPGTAAPAAGPFSQPEEQELQHACQQAVLAQIAAAAKGKLEGNDTLSLDCFSSTMIDRMKQACLTGPEGRTAVQKEVRSLLHSFFQRLRYISQSRLPLEELRRVTTSDIFSDTPAAVKPLLQQIGCQLRKGGELPDLMQPSSSSSLSGLISKGLGRIMMGAAGVSRQVARQNNPSRSKIVLMFVVGGVSLSEARAVSADMISSSGGARDGGFRSESLVEEGVHESPLIVVGSTALISPEDVCRKLLVC